MSRPIIVINNETPLIMEVVGEKGQKLKEYSVKSKDTATLPYYKLIESASL